MLTSRARKRDERGAIAVMYAGVLLFILIPIAALGIDLGNAVARKTHTRHRQTSRRTPAPTT